ncbi:hypothetical protein ABK040_007177 [Willaertia magna]
MWSTDNSFNDFCASSPTQQQDDLSVSTFANTTTNNNSVENNNTNNNNNNNNNANETKEKSKQPRKQKVACVYCNKLHKKCDGEAPNSCTRCKKKGIPCVYLPPQKRGPKSKKRKTNEKKDEHLEYIEQLTCGSTMCGNGHSPMYHQRFQQPIQSPMPQPQQQALYYPPTQQQSFNNFQQPTIPQSNIINNVDIDNYINELTMNRNYPQGSSSWNPNTSNSNMMNNNNSLISYNPSPLLDQQFVVSVHTRTLIDQFLDSVTCHSLVDRNLLDNAINKVVGSYNSDPTGASLLVNIACALGAQRIEDKKNMMEFFNRARHQAGLLFDEPSRETSCALSLMSIYACSEGERIKGQLYNKVAMEMSLELSNYQIDNDKYYQTFNYLSLSMTIAKFLFELNLLKIEDDTIEILIKNNNNNNSNNNQIQTFKELVKNIKTFLSCSSVQTSITDIENKVFNMNLVEGSEEMAFTSILLYYYLSSRIALVSHNQIEYISILRKLELLEKYLESESFKREDVQKNVHRFCLYSLRSDILVRCGLDKMGLHCATKATGLSAKPTFWKSSPLIIFFFPLLIKVNLSVNDSSMSIENYKALKLISSKFTVLKQTLFDMINVMNKRHEFIDLLESERNANQNFMPQGYSTVTQGNINFTNSNNNMLLPNDNWLATLDDTPCTSDCQDLTELLQQLGSANDQQDYQAKLESIWQSINTQQ